MPCIYTSKIIECFKQLTESGWNIAQSVKCLPSKPAALYFPNTSYQLTWWHKLIIPEPRWRRKGQRVLKITPEQSQFKFYQTPSQNKKRERGRTGRKGGKEEGREEGGCPLHRTLEISPEKYQPLILFPQRVGTIRT